MLLPGQEVYVLFPFPMCDTPSCATIKARLPIPGYRYLWGLGLWTGYWPVSRIGRTPEEAIKKAETSTDPIRPTSFTSGRAALGRRWR